MSSNLQNPEHIQVADILLQLKAGDNNAVLNAYLAALVAEGWTKTVLAELLSVSNQALAQRVATALSSTATVDLTAMPIPAAPPRRRRTKATRTQSGLPVPDTEGITRSAAQQAGASIAGFTGTPMERLGALGDFIDTWIVRLRDLEGERENLAWSLTCYDRQKDLAKAGGWERRTFYKRRHEVLGVSSEQLKTLTSDDLKALATSKGIQHRPNALAAYEQVASDIAETRAVLRVAEAARDTLITEVVTLNEANGRYQNVIAAAEAIHRSPSVIWQVLHQRPRGPQPGAA